jgi:protocatechuate 3,4-dioxygenase alpha subunit
VTTARTPSQTVGPFFQFALPWLEGPHVVPEGTAGTICVGGRLLDGRGDPIGDGLIETWQADPRGRLVDQAAPNGRRFRGFGRCATDRDGWYRIYTLKPGPIAEGSSPPHAPHLVFSIFARGMLKRAITRMYFPDEEAANRADPVLGTIAEADARASLVALPSPNGYRFDIRLQGEGETLFFDV